MQNPNAFCRIGFSEQDHRLAYVLDLHLERVWQKAEAGFKYWEHIGWVGVKTAICKLNKIALSKSYLIVLQGVTAVGDTESLEFGVRGLAGV